MKRILIAALIFAPVTALADVRSDVEAIDKNLNACLEDETNHNTVGMNMCIGEAFQAADKLLVKTVAEYGNSLTGEARRRLIRSQRAWFLFRNANAPLHGYGMMGGSGEAQIVGMAAYNMTKERALEIEAIFDGSNDI